MRSERMPVLALLSLAGALLSPGTARADWVFGAFLGHAQTQASTVVLTLPGQSTELELDGVEYRGESFRSPQYYGARATWIPDAHRWIGIEGEWIHAKVFSQVDRVVRIHGTLRGQPIDAMMPMSSLVQRLAMSHGLNFILANVAVRRGLGPVDARGMHRITAVVRAGAGPLRPHAESHVEHVPVDQYQHGGFGMQLGGGVELSLWRGLGALGEYKFTGASPEIDVAGGQATIPARSHHVVFGIGYGF